MRWLIPLLSMAVALVATAAPHAQHLQGAPAVRLPLKLTGAVISAGGVGNPTGTGRIEIAVHRWSSPEERTVLTEALTNQGEDALLDELARAKPVGTVRMNTGLAYDLRYASDNQLAEGGTRIFLATDRPMSVWEIWNAPEYSRYPFTLIELTFERDGSMKGSLLLAARVTAGSDGRFVYVENFATQPIPITSIALER